MARASLDTEPGDRSGEDRHLVIVQVSAESLPSGIPAGTSSAHDDHVPAGTLPRCGVVGQGRLEARTAERLACTGRVAVMVTDADGEVLHLGRSRRLASRAQRRALRLRDTTCTFPGCHQTRHLDAPHITPWSVGGLTDIEGLALLCRRHHVLVHEGGLRLVRAPSAAPSSGSRVHARFQVLDRSSSPVQARWPAMFERVTARPVHSEPPGVRTAGPEPLRHESTDQDPVRIAATTGGEGFRLADVVDALVHSPRRHRARSRSTLDVAA